VGTWEGYEPTECEIGKREVCLDDNRAVESLPLIKVTRSAATAFWDRWLPRRFPRRGPFRRRGSWEVRIEYE
jgi:hypothetical protein